MSSSDASSSSGEEEEEMNPPSKNPTITPAATPPPPNPSTATAKAPRSKPPPKSSTFPAQASHLSNSESIEDDDNVGEESSDDDGSNSDSDDNISKSKNLPLKSPATAMEPSDPDSSDGSGSDSDSESSDQTPTLRHSVRVADPSIKPLASKPMDELAKPRKPASDKKLKAPEVSLDPEGKRQPFQRIWSKYDELVVLNGLVDYQEDKGLLPSPAEMDAFCKFIEKSLSIAVSKTQLSDKVRKLKKKYVTAMSRGKNGVEPSFSKSDDQDVFELSKLIWGGKMAVHENGDADEYAEVDVTRKRQKVKDDDGSLDSSPVAFEHDNPLVAKYSYPLLKQVVLKTGTKQTASIATEAVEMVDSSKVAAFMGKYNKLALLGMKNNLRRMDLMKESVDLFRKALEKLV